MKKQLFITIILFFGNPVFSQKKYEWKTNNSEPYTYNYVSNDPTETRFYRLKNGLTVILSPNTQQPRINCFVAVRSGANNDPQNQTGLAHYLEHLLFKGTDKFGTSDWEKEKPLLDSIQILYEKHAQTADIDTRKSIYKEIDRISGLAAKYAISNEYDKALATIGGKGTNAFTSYEQTVYVDNIPSNAIENYLTIQKERFRNPIFRTFHTELETVYEEKNRALDNDSRKLEEATLRLIFKNHNYGKQTVLGTVEHLKSPSLVAIQQYCDTYYVPNNIAIILVGDLDPNTTIKRIDDAFGQWKSKEFPSISFPAETMLTDTLREEVWGPTPESVRIAFRIPGQLDFRSSITAILADELMSNSTTGFIDLNLVKQQKILSGNSGLRKMRDYGVFLMNGTPKEKQTLDEVKNMLLVQLNLLKAGKFEDKDITAIINNYRRRSLEAQKDNSSRSYNLLEAFIIDNTQNWHLMLAQTDEMSKITKADIVKFVNQYYQFPVVIYKRKGNDASIKKIEKPIITPLTLNRNGQSEFLKSVSQMTLSDMKPQWIDYQKDLKIDKACNSKLYYTHNHQNDLFSLVYRLDFGRFHDKKLGIAIEYLSLLNTKKYTSEQIRKSMYEIASDYSIYPENKYTLIEVSGLQENFKKSVDYFQELVLNCQPDQEVLESLKKRILKKREEAKLNKANIMKALTSYATYGSQNPYNYILSNQEVMDLKAEELTDLLHKILQFSSEMVYYGPVSLNELKNDLEKIKIPTINIEKPQMAVFQKQNTDSSKVFFVDYDMIQAEMQWVKNTSVFDSSLTPIISLYNNYVGGNMASVVFQTIREAKALAYTTYANYQKPENKSDNYTLTAYVATQADKLPEAVESMNQIFSELPESQQSFDNSVKSLKNLLESDRVLPQNMAFNYFQVRELGIRQDQRAMIYNNLKKFKLSDIKSFHEGIAHGKFNYCLLASEKKIKLDEMSKYGKIIKVSKEQIFGY